jgi:hypothetical protein
MSEIDPPPPLRHHPALRVAADVAFPILVVAVLLAPAVITAARTPPAVVRAVPDRTSVIHVDPFENHAAESCTRDPPLHVGPSSVQGKLTNKGALRTRMTAAVSQCEADWFGAVTLSVKIDEAGSIRDVRADAGPDGRMRTCVIRNVLREGPVEAHGPGALTIGYFMGTRSI